MPIKVGDRLPDTKFRVMTTEGPVWKTTDEVFKGRKVALFAVPGKCEISGGQTLLGQL
jgi:peroxiredoxin